MINLTSWKIQRDQHCA